MDFSNRHKLQDVCCWCRRYGIQIPSRLNLNTLPTTRHRCNIDVWALVQCCRDGHRSLVTPEKVLNEYNKDLTFFFIHAMIFQTGYFLRNEYFCKVNHDFSESSSIF